MKYELVLFERGETPADLKATVVCAHDSWEAMEKFIEAGKVGPVKNIPDIFLNIREPRKGRRVRVIDVSEDSPIPRDVIHINETFPSAAAATERLANFGVKATYNIVLKKLEAVKFRPAEERIIEIAGIRFQYEDDFLAGIHI